MVIRYWLPEQVANSHLSPWVLRKRLKAAQIMAWSSAKQAGWRPVPFGKARLTVTLVFPVKRKRDVDNLHARCKGVVDGLKEWLVDDDTEHLDLVVRAEVRAGVKQTEVELEAA